MENPPEHLKLLTSVPSEVEAAIIVAALKEAGIETVATGTHTTSRQIPNMEWVQVMVAEYDLPVAANTLQKLKEENAEIDWSQVDVGDPPAEDD